MLQGHSACGRVCRRGTDGRAGHAAPESTRGDGTGLAGGPGVGAARALEPPGRVCARGLERPSQASESRPGRAASRPTPGPAPSPERGGRGGGGERAGLVRPTPPSRLHSPRWSVHTGAGPTSPRGARPRRPTPSPPPEAGVRCALIPDAARGRTGASSPVVEGRAGSDALTCPPRAPHPSFPATPPRRLASRGPPPDVGPAGHLFGHPRPAPPGEEPQATEEESGTGLPPPCLGCNTGARSGGGGSVSG